MEDNKTKKAEHTAKTREKVRVQAASPQFEAEFMDFACGQVKNPLLSKRLRYLLVWYDAKARGNRRGYHFCRNWTSILPSVITLVSVVGFLWKNGSNYVPAITATISVLITIVHHHMDHYRYYENWVRYRGASEDLKRETMLFLNRCAPYDEGADDEIERRFAAQIEEIAAKEHANWENLREDSHHFYLTDKETHEQSKKD